MSRENGRGRNRPKNKWMKVIIMRACGIDEYMARDQKVYGVWKVVGNNTSG